MIDVSSINKSAVFITLSADVLQTDTPLIIAGLEKGYDCSEVKSVFITVDTEGQDVYNSNSHIKLFTQMDQNAVTMKQLIFLIAPSCGILQVWGHHILGL